MKFFELTNSDGGTAHIPVERFLRIQTFDDEADAIVQVMFQNQVGQDPFIVNINVTKGHETRVANMIKNGLSAEGDFKNFPITIKPNNAESLASISKLPLP